MKVEHRIDGVSVIVCCCNSAPRIEETLRHLALQQTGNNLAWEIILVNNNSTDNTVAIARQYWDLFGEASVALRIEEEHTPGLSHARKKGLAASQYSLAIFCDDDNWLSKNYVRQAWDLMQRNAHAGIIGGWSEGAFAITPRQYLLPFLPAIAVGKLAKANGPVEYAIGGGMVLRMACYTLLEEKGSRTLLEDRKGSKATYGGDVELCWKVRYSGYEILFDESLFFKHFIPAARLHARYFLRLSLSFVSPFIVTEAYRHCFQQSGKPFSSFWRKTMAQSLQKTIYYFPRMFLGKYQFYSLVSFLQSWKIVAVLMMKVFLFYRYFRIIEQEKKNLSRV